MYNWFVEIQNHKFKVKEKELRNKLEKYKSDEEEYPKIAKVYLNFLKDSLLQKVITDGQFDNTVAWIVLTNFTKKENKILDEIEDICNKLDIPGNLAWFKNDRNRDITRKELFNLLENL